MGERVVFVLVNVGINGKVEIDKTSIKDHSKVKQLNLHEFKPYKIVIQIENCKIFVLNYFFFSPGNQFVGSKKFKEKNDS